MATGELDLRPLLREIERQAARLSSQIDQVDASVGVVRNDLVLTGNELRDLRQEFDEYVKTAQRAAAKQSSETRVGNLKAERDRRFGHYDVVRRTSVGLLQAFDVGNVTNSSVRQISEELMIQTPRYWLAPVIVALAAWSRDNQEMAEKSVQEAYARDAAKTSLFFTLVMRRQGRLDAATRWLRHYLSSLDPHALGREFAVILEATSYNAFGPAAQRLMSTTMTTWCSELRANTETVEAQIRSWDGELKQLREELTPHSYPALTVISPQFDSLQAMLEQASALPVAIDKYVEIAKHEAKLPSVLETLLDDILDQLCTEYDAEELPLRREVLYHEAVIEEEGDTTKARRRADELQKALDETNDVVSMQTMAALSPELIGVSTQTQRIAIGVGGSDFRTAVGRHCATYRSHALTELTLDFHSRHSQYATTYGFKGCSMTTSLPEQQGIQQIVGTWQRTFAEYIDKISFKNSYYTKPALIAGAVALVIFLINPGAGIAALLVGAAIVIFRGVSEQKKCDAAVAAVERIRQKAVDLSVDLYRDANAEFVDAMRLYRDLDSQEAELLTLIDTWPTVSNAPEEESA